MGIVGYIKETRAEMKHVTWPSRSQVTVFTFAVIAVSVLTSVYLGLFDFVLSRALETALSGAGQEVPAALQEENLPFTAPTGNTGPAKTPTESGSTPTFDPGAILNGGVTGGAGVNRSF